MIHRERIASLLRTAADSVLNISVGTDLRTPTEPPAEVYKKLALVQLEVSLSKKLVDRAMEEHLAHVRKVWMEIDG